MSKFTDCYAVPGENHIIDTIDPDTGLTWISRETFEQVAARYPKAVRMNLDDFCRDKAARQRTPIEWIEVSSELFDRQLGVLPPIDWDGRYFLVGEPSHHMADSGEPAYQAYRRVGGKFEGSSRAITRRELASTRDGVLS